MANNLASWRHSGFHVHASSPFILRKLGPFGAGLVLISQDKTRELAPEFLMPGDADLLRTRLAYAFRPPVALGRMDFDGITVTVRTNKKQLLQLSPIDFLAKLTTHIPDRYQNIRRYAGFYASVVQAHVRRAAVSSGQPAHDVRIESAKPIRPQWALLIARIFGTLPIACPKCNTVMELKACITDPIAIARVFPNIARAPPQLTFDRYQPPVHAIAYGKIGDEVSGEPAVEATDSDAQFNQAAPDNDAFFNQDIEG